MPGRSVINIFDGGVGVAQPGVSEPVGEPPVVALGVFAVEQHGEPIGMRQRLGVGVVAEFTEGAGHAVQFEMAELVEGRMVEHGGPQWK